MSEDQKRERGTLCFHMAEGQREQTHSGSSLLQRPYSSALITGTPPSTVALGIKFSTDEFWGKHADHSQY